MSPRQRVRFLERFTPDRLTNEIRAPDIDSSVAQALGVISKESSGPVDFPELNSDAVTNQQAWTHFHLLSWYSKRLCPISYLEIGSHPGASMAIVGLNSPETDLVLCRTDREQSLFRLHFRPDLFVRELARRGLSRPLVIVNGDGLTGKRQYVSDWALRSRGRGQPLIKEFDLIFVDGSCRQGGIFQALKNALARCALGGMLVFRGKDRPEGLMVGQYCPRLSGYWERLPLRFPGFRFLKAPQGKEIGVACRVA